MTAIQRRQASSATPYVMSLTRGVRFATIAIALALTCIAYATMRPVAQLPQGQAPGDVMAHSKKASSGLVRGPISIAKQNAADRFSTSTCGGALMHQKALQPFMLGNYEVVTNINAGDLETGATLPYTAITLLFHGCRTDGIYWQQGVAERLFVGSLLEKGSAAIAFSTAAKGSVCWVRNTDPTNLDAKMVLTVLKTLADSNPAFGELPLMAVGVSGGAKMVDMFALVLNLHAIGQVIADISVMLLPDFVRRDRELWSHWTKGLPRAWTADGAPRIVFLHMPKDEKTANGIEKQIQLLDERGGVEYRVFTSESFPFNSSFFHEYMPTRFTLAESEELFYNAAPSLSEDVDKRRPPRSAYSSMVIDRDPRLFFPVYLEALHKIIVARGDDFTAFTDPISSYCCDEMPDGSFVSNSLCRISDLDTLHTYTQFNVSDPAVAIPASEEVEALAVAVMKLFKIAYGFHEMTWEHRNEVLQAMFAPKAKV